MVPIDYYFCIMQLMLLLYYYYYYYLHVFKNHFIRSMCKYIKIKHRIVCTMLFSISVIRNVFIVKLMYNVLPGNFRVVVRYSLLTTSSFIFHSLRYIDPLRKTCFSRVYEHSQEKKFLADCIDF